MFVVIVSVSLDEETVKKNTAVNGVSVMTTAVLSMTTPSVEVCYFYRNYFFYSYLTDFSYFPLERNC